MAQYEAARRVLESLPELALIDGYVKFEHKSKTRLKVSVYPTQDTAATNAA